MSLSIIIIAINAQMLPQIDLSVPSPPRRIGARTGVTGRLVSADPPLSVTYGSIVVHVTLTE